MVFLKFCNRVKKIFDTFTDNGFLKNTFYYNIWVEFSEIVPKSLNTIIVFYNVPPKNTEKTGDKIFLVS